MKITYGTNPEILNSYAMMVHDSVAVTLPENYTAMAFIGNGTALYLQDNSDIENNTYSIYIWTVSNATSIKRATLPTTPYSFYRACFALDNPSPAATTLFALDRDKTALIIWDFTNSTLKAVPLNQNNLWVHSIESMAWSSFESTLYALDRNGTVWQISLNGECTVYSPAQWPAIRSNVASNQLIIHPTTGVTYYLGYDVTINNYLLVTVTNKSVNVVPIHNGLLGLQWISLTLFSST